MLSHFKFACLGIAGSLIVMALVPLLENLQTVRITEHIYLHARAFCLFV